MGWGLAIVHKLTQLMSGSVSLKSNFGQGTTFYLELPFQQVKEEKQECLEHPITQSPCANQDNSSTMSKSFTPPSEFPLRGYRIMAVDDNDLNLLLLEQTLKVEGAETIMCDSGQVALDKASEFKVDAILMDLQMPKMDGCQTTLAIREKLKARIPIIALTAGAT